MNYSKSIIQKALKKTFAPEFLNRIDDVVMFNHLNREDIHKIIDIELKGLYDRIRALGYSIKIIRLLPEISLLIKDLIFNTVQDR